MFLLTKISSLSLLEHLFIATVLEFFENLRLIWIYHFDYNLIFYRRSPKLTVAERISALERQQQQQQQPQQPNVNLGSSRYAYFDPDKRHKVSGPDLKVMQKKALLMYYERHHSSWRSEPQLSPIPSPPQPPPPRPRLPTPMSRRSSSASDYQDSIGKEVNYCRSIN